jgi:hypothetical protein
MTIFFSLAPISYNMSELELYNSITTKPLFEATIKTESGMDIICNFENDSKNETIGQISKDGFELNLNKMITDKKYYLQYYDSTYETYKNQKGQLVITEIEIE